MSSQPKEPSRAVLASTLCLTFPLPFLPRVSFVQMPRGKEWPSQCPAPSLGFCLKSWIVAAYGPLFKVYLASLALGRLTHKLPVSVTGSGEALGVFSHLKPHVKCTVIILIIFDTGENKTQRSMLSTHGCVFDQNPQLPWAVSVPLQLGKKVEQAAHAAWGQRSRSALFPCP